MAITRITRDELLAIACKYWGTEVSLSIQSIPKLDKDKNEVIATVTIYNVKFKDKTEKEEMEQRYLAEFETKNKDGITFKEAFNQMVLERRKAFKQFHNEE